MNNFKVIIISEVLKFIENEVRKIDDLLETGGLLLGTKQEDGSRLVTHALPPGPKALHHSTMFERDLEFSQAALNYFSNKSNVEYVGEWHKHPSGLTRPSEGDRQGVINILGDKDYKTGGVMVFPIFILEKKNNYSIDSVQKVVRVFPYYMDKSGKEFKKFIFQVANCAIGTQEEVKNFQQYYLIFKGYKKGSLNFPVSHSNYEIIKNRETLTLYKYIFNSIDKMKDSFINFFEEKISSPSTKNADVKDDSAGIASDEVLNEDKKEPKEAKQETPWYKTVSGKKILASENLLAKEIDSFKSVSKLEDGSLVFHFKPANAIFSTLDIICQPNHPKTFPRLLVKAEDFDIELPSEKNQLLKDLSIKVKKLNKKWDSQEIYNISEIAKELIDTNSIDSGGIVTDSQDISQGERENTHSDEKKWYDTTIGKKVLKEETIALKQWGLDYQIKKLQNKQLVITINNFNVNNK
ncbi:MAG: Mov34/MPN/PAD-1 family protein, partial [Promethearchaeota archaeon]